MKRELYEEMLRDFEEAQKPGISWQVRKRGIWADSAMRAAATEITRWGIGLANEVERLQAEVEKLQTERTTLLAQRETLRLITQNYREPTLSDAAAAHSEKEDE